MLPDECPVVLCRVNAPERMQADLDGWMPKHFDDALRHPAVRAAANYPVRTDWDRLPSVFNGDCTRFIPYAYESVDGLIAAIDGPAAREAIEDGAEREGQYPLLDGEPFNGVTSVDGSCGREFAGSGPVLAERFHVPEGELDGFDRWLGGSYRQRALEWPGVVRVRTLAAAPGIPQRWPHDRYQGKGNRMLWVEFADGADIEEVAASPQVRAALEESVRWDPRLPYVRRDAAECLLVHTAARA
jgi:hypothetical protein